MKAIRRRDAIKWGIMQVEGWSAIGLAELKQVSRSCSARKTHYFGAVFSIMLFFGAIR